MALQASWIAGEQVDSTLGARKPVGQICCFIADGSGNFLPLLVPSSGLITSFEYLPGSTLNQSTQVWTTGGTSPNGLTPTLTSLRGTTLGIGGAALSNLSTQQFVTPGAGVPVDESGGFALTPTGNTTAGAVMTIIVNLM